MSRIRSIFAIAFLGFAILIISGNNTAISQEPTILEQIENLKVRLEEVKNREDGSGGAETGDIFKEQEMRDLHSQIDTLEDKLCISCVIIIKYADLVNKYVKELSAKVLPGMIVMFSSLVGLWIVLQGYKILFGMSQPQQLYMEFIYVAIGFILLNHIGAEFVDRIYQATLAIIGSASEMAFVLAEKPKLEEIGLKIDIKSYESLLQLVYTVEQAIRKVLSFTGNLLSGSSVWQTGDALLNVFYAIILILPYFLVGVVYFSQLVISVFRLMMLSAFSPFLMMAYAFGWGRGMAQSAIKTVISSIAIMFAVTAAVALVVYAVDSTNMKFLAGEKIDISNTQLILLITLGWMSTAFMAEATHIANSVTGSSLSNTGVGIITAGVTATGAGILAQKGYLRKGYSALKSRTGLESVGQIGQGQGGGTLYDKVKSVSRGGSDS